MEMNNLYRCCNRFIGKETNTIGVRFYIKTNEKKEIRRNDINSLYFSVIDSLLTKEMIEDLYLIRHFVRTNDKEGVISKKIDNIVANIANGKIEQD